jgi:uncharacterized Tic20 family protein
MANDQNTQYGGAGPHTSYGGPPPSGAANPGGAPPPAGAPLPPPARSSNNETVVAGIAHLSSFFAPLVVPLIIWLITRDSMPYASRQGKQAFFFHLLISALGLVVAFVLFFSFVTTIFATTSQAITSETAPAPSIGFPAWFFALITFAIIIGLSSQVLSIYGAVQAFQGKDFSYPLLGWL